MKASSQPTLIPKRLRRVIITAAVLIALLLMAPHISRFVVSLAIAPVVHTKQWFLTSSASLPQYLRNRSALLEDMEDLKNQLATMRADQYVNERLSKENETLRQLLHDGDDDRIVAGVIGRPTVLPYDVLLLDKGSSSGIQAGAPVYVGTQTVIGVVRSVSNTTAVVDMVTSPNFSSLVYIVGPNVYAVANGVGGGQLRVGVPQGVDVAMQDLVILPSVSPGVFGVVTHIENRPTQAEQLVYVTPEVAIRELRLVTVGEQPVLAPDASTIEATTAEAVSLLVPTETLSELGATSTASSTATTSVPEQID